VIRGTKLLAIVAALVAFVLTPAIAFGGRDHAASNSTTYPDSVGEDPLAPEIIQTMVSNDDTGLITIRLAITNRPALTPDMLIELDVDADANSATGDAAGLVPGTDYIVQLMAGAVDLFKWNGSDYPGVAAPSLVFAYDAAGATIRINATELGGSRKLKFAAIAYSGLTASPDGGLDGTNAHADQTPDRGHGAFTYEVRVTVRLKAASLTISPTTVKAGQAFSVSFASTESDTGSPVDHGAVTCTARVAGKALKVRSNRLVNGIAVCAWTAPRTAKGRRVTGSVTLNTKGAAVTRSFSTPIT
jgi:hypothetical protein